VVCLEEVKICIGEIAKVSSRLQREIAHGKNLTVNDPEKIWGWGTPAGVLRAKRRAHLIIERAGMHSGMRVLEIGCGTGLFTEKFASTGAYIVAVDISDDLLELARQRNLPPTVKFVHSSFEGLSQEKPFDAVVGSSILHHLDINNSLQSIYRLLQPGGVMCFAEPNMANPQIVVQKNVPFIKKWLGDSPDETAFFRWTLKKKMEKYNFEKIIVEPFDWLHPATPEPLIIVVRKFGQRIEKIPILRELAGSLLITGFRKDDSEDVADE